MAKRDYYDILGVQRSASAAEIKRAHRKLARKYHPDVAKDDPTAAPRFQEVQEAYDVLSDPDKRRRYDSFGFVGAGAGAPGQDPFEAFRRSQSGGGPGGFGGAGGGYGPGGFRVDQLDPEEVEELRNGQFADVFESLFGSAGPFGRRGARPRPGPEDYAQSRSARPADLNVEYPASLSFEQAAAGITLSIPVSRGTVTETIEAKVPPGVKDGQRVRLRGQGQQLGGHKGDLILVVAVSPHPWFRRDGNDLLVDVPVSVWEALLGARVDVPTLAGEVTLTIPAGASSGQKFRVKGMGLAGRDGFGDLFAVLKVVTPRDLDDVDRDTLQRLAGRYPVDARRDVPWK